MTGYAVACFMEERLGTIERFEGVFITTGSFLLVMVTSSGKAISKHFRSELPLTPDGVRFLMDVLNEHLTKKELGGVTLERIRAMEQELGEYRGLIGPLLQIIYDVVAQISKESILVKGAANLLSFLEFYEAGKAESILRELEDEKALRARFRQSFSDRVRIHIATGGEGLDETSVVICPFRLRGSLEGAVCIIGPKRMNYGKAMARLEYIAKQINAVHGFEPKIPLIETKES
jgi:heat-inducible transcriptional repressor